MQRLTCKETTVSGTAYDFFPLELWKQLRGEPAPADRQRVLQIGGRDALGVLEVAGAWNPPPGAVRVQTRWRTSAQAIEIEDISSLEASQAALQQQSAAVSSAGMLPKPKKARFPFAGFQRCP